MAIWSFWKQAQPALQPQGAAGVMAAAAGPLALDIAATGQRLRVPAVHGPVGLPDWARWLAEIGFLPGETVTVMSRSVWGGDPMVVRVGESTFALRRAEAACVQVEAA
jgi:ferrous iron transport protein A